GHKPNAHNGQDRSEKQGKIFKVDAPDQGYPRKGDDVKKQVAQIENDLPAVHVDGTVPSKAPDGTFEQAVQKIQDKDEKHREQHLFLQYGYIDHGHQLGIIWINLLGLNYKYPNILENNGNGFRKKHLADQLFPPRLYEQTVFLQG